MSEEIGRHKGAVETLLHEKKELSRLLQIVNSQLERHLSALEEAGIDTDQFIQDIQQQGQGKQQNRKRKQKSRKQESRGNSRQNSQKQSNRRQKSGRSSDEDGDRSKDTGDRDFSPL